MFDSIHSDFQFTDPAEVDHLLPLRAFAVVYREALINAGALLGGPRGAGVARAVIESLAQQERPTRLLMRKISQLVELLTLEHVHDMSRDEAAHFALIDPLDPCVDEICLLTDGLLEALDQCGLLLPDEKVAG